jgi:hypothetical protein
MSDRDVLHGSGRGKSSTCKEPNLDGRAPVNQCLIQERRSHGGRDWGAAQKQTKHHHVKEDWAEDIHHELECGNKVPCSSHLGRLTTCLVLSCASISVARIVSSKGRDSHDSDISVSSAFFRPCSFSRASISSALQRWW